MVGVAMFEVLDPFPNNAIPVEEESSPRNIFGVPSQDTDEPTQRLVSELPVEQT